MTWAAVVSQFGSTARRRRLLEGLRAAALALREAGCRVLYLDGSFASSKANPNDFDACWDPAGVDLARLDAVLKVFSDGRAAQKAKYFGELFPATAPADDSGATFLEFFQRDRDGIPKGIIVIDLRSILP